MAVWENLGHAMYEGVGEYGFPESRQVIDIPNIDEWISFNFVKPRLRNKSKTGVHFYITDQQFERVWNFPDRYGVALSEFGAVVGTDFSVYTDFPPAMAIYNTYRNRWLTRYWQDNGVYVIPNVRFGTKDTWNWCFDGLPQDSVVAISNVGFMNKPELRKLFMDGYNEMLTRLQPRKIIFYAKIVDDYKGPVQFVHFSMDKTIYKETEC